MSNSNIGNKKNMIQFMFRQKMNIIVLLLNFFSLYQLLWHQVNSCKLHSPNGYQSSEHILPKVRLMSNKNKCRQMEKCMCTILIVIKETNIMNALQSLSDTAFKSMLQLYIYTHLHFVYLWGLHSQLFIIDCRTESLCPFQKVREKWGVNNHK